MSETSSSHTDTTRSSKHSGRGSTTKIMATRPGTIRRSHLESWEKRQKWLKEAKENLFHGDDRLENNMRRKLDKSGWGGVSSVSSSHQIITTTTHSRSRGAKSVEPPTTGRNGSDSDPPGRNDNTARRGFVASTKSKSSSSKSSKGTRPGPRMMGLMRYVTKI